MKKWGMLGGLVLLAALVAYPVFAWGPGWGGGPMMGYGGYYGGGPMMGYGGYGGGPGSCWGNGRGYGNPGNSNPSYGNLTDEQEKKLDDLNRTFFDETASLRSEIWQKSNALQDMLDSPTPDVEKSKALQKEISDLKAKMAEKRLSYDLEVRKIAPNGPETPYGRGYGRGYGRSMMGGGPRFGGWGQGACWN
jgi:Spy/CpxP family protein refolding chaperone